jgi:hypothetical protein
MDGITGKVKSLPDCINPVITAGGNFKPNHPFLFIEHRKKAEIATLAFERNEGSAASVPAFTALKSSGSRLNAKSGCLTFKGLKQDPVNARVFFFYCVHSSSPQFVNKKVPAAVTICRSTFYVQQERFLTKNS